MIGKAAASSASAAAQPVIWTLLGYEFEAASMIAGLCACLMVRIWVSLNDRSSKLWAWGVDLTVTAFSMLFTAGWIVLQRPAPFYALMSGTGFGALGAASSPWRLPGSDAPCRSRQGASIKTQATPRRPASLIIMSAEVGDSRSLDDLHPQVKAMAEELLARCAAADAPLTVTFTLRSWQRQAELYAQGRTAPGKIVTNAKAGHSFHNYGLALDVVPTELLALPDWGDTPEHEDRTDQLWAQVGAIGKAIGFRWGGDFRRLPDRPHFEWSGGLMLAALRAGTRPIAPAATKPNAINKGEKA